MKATVIIQARMNSTRLPGKIFMELADKKVLEHVVLRARAAQNVQRVIVATTTSAADDPVVEFCRQAGIDVFRGQEDDVLDRYYQTAQAFKAPRIARVTADCPVLDPGILDRTIMHHFSTKADYTSNILHPTFPDGLDVEVFTFNALETAWKNAKLKSEREHVTPYIRNHPQEFRQSEVVNDVDLSAKRWTLDDPKDYEFLKAVFSGLYKGNSLFGMNDILKYVEKFPELEYLNRDTKRNEGYIKSLQHDKG